MADSQSSSDALLTEIRDLLRQQNALIADIKRMNQEVAAQSLAAVQNNQAGIRDLQSLHASVTKGNIKYFAAFLVFIVLLVALAGGHFRSLLRMLGM